jgi:hypothetical protein
MTTTLSDWSIDQAMRHPLLFGAVLGDITTWRTWEVVLKAAWGRALSEDELSVFKSIAGGREPPERRVRELWTVLGRRSGKSRIAALIAVYLGTFVKYPKLAPGETGHVLVQAASKSQAQAVFRYARAFLDQSPVLKAFVDEVLQEEIRLNNGITISVHSTSYRSVRGRTVCGAVLDEVAFWKDETSMAPDLEFYRAIRPALATTNGVLIGISTGYSQRGLLYGKYRDFYGANDPDNLVLAGTTKQFNPTIDTAVIDQAMADDPEAAAAEWNGVFRGDLSSYVDEDVIRECVEKGTQHRPFETARRYVAFVDSSSGARDSYTLALAYRDGERIALAVAKEWKAPFDPVNVSEEISETLKAYRVTRVYGDAYASGFVQSTFKSQGISYQHSDKTRSELYLTLLPMLMARNVVLLDNHRIISQFVNLERRTSRTGRDAVDHRRDGQDDLANAVAGALVMAGRMSATAAGAKRDNPMVRLGHSAMKRLLPAYGGRVTHSPKGNSNRDPDRKVSFQADGSSVDTVAN